MRRRTIPGKEEVEYPEMVTVALAEASGKSRDSTVTVTVEPIGEYSGAVINACGRNRADVELPPKTPFTNQSTFVVVAPVTVGCERLRIGGARGHYARC